MSMFAQLVEFGASGRMQSTVGKGAMDKALEEVNAALELVI